MKNTEIIIGSFNESQEKAFQENHYFNKQNTVTNTVTRTIDKTTYIVGLHFKEQGMTFSEVLKRVLKGAD